MAVVEKVRNQYGEEIVAQEIYLSNGNWWEEGINCFSSSDLGLGTCRCVSHDPKYVEPISRSYVLRLLSEKPELVSQLSQEEKKDLLYYINDLKYRIFCDLEDYFNMTIEKLSEAFATCYNLGINPLPRLREALRELGYENVEVRYWSSFDSGTYYDPDPDEVTLFCCWQEGDEQVEFVLLIGESVEQKLPDIEFDDEVPEV